MDLATLSITKDQAREALVHYRKGVREFVDNKEYAAIYKGLHRVVRGQNLIELSKVIAAGGEDEAHRPRLAVLRADQVVCSMVRFSDGEVVYGSGDSGRHLAEARSRGRVILASGTLPRNNLTVRGRSIVPLIPPQLMPKGDLSRYHILWEATWEDVPADPALLQHLGGDLWAVLAVWDLTPLERAVLRGRGN